MNVHYQLAQQTKLLQKEIMFDGLTSSQKKYKFANLRKQKTQNTETYKVQNTQLDISCRRMHANTPAPTFQVGLPFFQTFTVLFLFLQNAVKFLEILAQVLSSHHDTPKSSSKR